MDTTIPSEWECSVFAIAVIGDVIVGIENRDGNTNVRFNQKETLERIFKRLEASGVHVARARMDCGSCSEEIVGMVEAHCKYFYIRANRCSSLYDTMSSLTDWQSVEINGIEFELNSILVEKWKGKLYRLVIHRQHRGSFTLATSQLEQDKLADPIYTL